MKVLENVKSPYLNIRALSDEELEKLIESTEQEDLKCAYAQMYNNCILHPEDRLWYTSWEYSLRKDNTVLGYIGFKGPAINESVEIGYGIKPEFEGKGYTQEAVKAMLDWAFRNEGIFFVEAETDQYNEASKQILEKLGFVHDGFGEEGPRYVKEKPSAKSASFFMILGIALGLLVGWIINKSNLCMCIGLAVGLALGYRKDGLDKGKLSAAKERREKRKK